MKWSREKIQTFANQIYVQVKRLRYLDSQVKSMKAELAEYIMDYQDAEVRDEAPFEFEYDNLGQIEALSEPCRVRVGVSQRTTVKYDAAKVAKKLKAKGVDPAQVLKTKCEVTDPQSFMAYMKELGADPKKVKSFLNTTKEVDAKAIDRLIDLGEVRIDDLAGSYRMNIGEPYVTFREIKG